MKKITSIHNPLLKTLTKPPYVVLQGDRLIETALRAGVEITHIFIHLDALSQSMALVSQIPSAEVFEVSLQVLKKLTDTTTPQGIAVVARCSYADASDISLREMPLIIACESIQDPGNVGTIIRTADACALQAVVLLEGSADLYNPKTIRASAGSIFNIPICKMTTDDFVRYCAHHRLQILVSDVKATNSMYEMNFRQASAVVLGNEAVGVSQRLKTVADAKFSIPMLGKAQSLNVAISASVILYEAIRQRQNKNRL